MAVTKQKPPVTVEQIAEYHAQAVEYAKTAEVIFINHSGGKDSQAMLAAMVRLGYAAKIVIIHSDLGDMEWEPMESFITKNSFGLRVVVAKPAISFWDLCRKYGRLPGGTVRFCTDELKSAPITEWIKSYCLENGYTRALSCMGIRAEESPSRAAKPCFRRCKRSTKAIQIMEWFPIFDYLLGQVWDEIRAAGQEPHPIYSKGFSRLSCVFCVYGRIAEHQLAATMRPELRDMMANLERELGKSIRMKQTKGVKSNRFLDEYC